MPVASNAYLEFGKHKYLFAGNQKPQKQRRIFSAAGAAGESCGSCEDCDIKVDLKSTENPINTVNIISNTNAGLRKESSPEHLS